MCENHRFCLCFGVFLRISQIQFFVKSMFCDLVFHCFSGKSWFYACDPMCENHRFCLCFGVLFRIYKFTISWNSCFCDLLFDGFWGWNRGVANCVLSWLVVVLVVVSSFAVVCDFLRRVSGRVFLVLCSGCFARLPFSRLGRTTTGRRHGARCTHASQAPVSICGAVLSMRSKY